MRIHFGIILGAKWKIHYYAHLESIHLAAGFFVNRTSLIGHVGDRGNAKGKQAHLHYSTISIIPWPWLWSNSVQGWKRMFYLKPTFTHPQKYYPV